MKKQEQKQDGKFFKISADLHTILKKMAIEEQRTIKTVSERIIIKGLETEAKMVL
jgi:hypothetical protein